jgi:trk system potassium uptake protein TrkA
MKIVIVGAGEVGSYLCGMLSGHAHEVTLIESEGEIVSLADEQYDVRVLEGNGSSAETLKKAEVENCDFFLAMTSDDKTNLISSSLAKALGAGTTIARIHDQTYTDNSYLNYQLHFGIDMLLNPEALCAVELAKTIRNPGRVAVENFARGQIEVQQVQLAKKSKLSGKTLAELKLNPKMRIGAIQRADKIELPTGDSILEAGDWVTLFGPPDVMMESRVNFNPDSTANIVRVVLFGGSEISIALVRLLANPRFKIRIIDSDREKCDFLAEKFPHVTVINGDATRLRLLEEEQIGSTDYFIACTKNDENNIMTGLQSSKLGAAHVQIVINKTDYEEVLDRMKSTLGIELSVSPRIATVNEVMRYLSPATYTELADLPNKAGKILEIRISGKSSQTGRLIKDIPLPSGTVFVALLHKFQAVVPGAEDIILEGDRVVVITKEDDIKELLNLFT